MPLHKSHDKVRVEVARPDELPDGLPDPTGPEEPAERDALGRFAPGNQTLARKGGKRRAGALKLSRTLGLKKGQETALEPYLEQARKWQRTKIKELARDVGGGYCGPGPASIISTAARQLASSMFLFDLACDSPDPDLHARASKLGADSRQSLLAAHELCSKEAAARPKQNPTLALIESIKGSDD